MFCVDYIASRRAGVRPFVLKITIVKEQNSQRENVAFARLSQNKGERGFRQAPPNIVIFLQVELDARLQRKLRQLCQVRNARQ